MSLWRRECRLTGVCIPVADLMCTCLKASFWITWAYTFLPFSHVWGPDGFSPEKSVQSSTCLSWHMRCVHLLLHGPRCVVIVAICSSWGSACYHTVHCLKEMNDYGKLMPFGYFLRRFASWNLIPFIFLFYLHKECRLSLLSYHWGGLDKLEWQIKRQIKIGL